MPGRVTNSLAALLLLALGACGSVQVPMNQPLAMTAAGPPDYAANYGLMNLMRDSDEDGDDLLVFVAFSGGGKRSAAFAHGVLRGLRGIPVRRDGQPERRLLDLVDYISGVSGGSFPAMHYGLYRDRSFETFPAEFLNVDINAYIYGAWLLPWNWDWIVNPFFGTNDRMAQVYDTLMFRRATYGDLARRGRPLISVNATDIANGVSFPFLGTNFGLLCSDLNRFPVSRAVAASNGFPVLFSPITLENHASLCGGQRPPLAPPSAWADPRSEEARRAQLARIANRYADPDRTRWVHLMDGGIADNLALRGMLNTFIALDDGDGVFRNIARRTRRILVISVDGQAAPDPTLGQQRLVNGLSNIFGAVSGTQIDSYNFETLLLAETQVKGLAERMAAFRCREAPVIDGRPCGDVQGALVHVALSGIDDPVERARLQSIPTGLSIPAEDVVALVAYGERLAAENPVLRGMAEGLAPSPSAVPAPRRRVVATRP